MPVISIVTHEKEMVETWCIPASSIAFVRSKFNKNKVSLGLEIAFKNGADPLVIAAFEKTDLIISKNGKVICETKSAEEFCVFFVQSEGDDWH